MNMIKIVLTLQRNKDRHMEQCVAAQADKNKERAASHAGALNAYKDAIDLIETESQLDWMWRGRQRQSGL